MSKDRIQQLNLQVERDWDRLNGLIASEAVLARQRNEVLEKILEARREITQIEKAAKQNVEKG